jgi:hypothetical protein
MAFDDPMDGSGNKTTAQNIFPQQMGMPHMHPDMIAPPELTNYVSPYTFSGEQPMNTAQPQAPLVQNAAAGAPGDKTPPLAPPASQSQTPTPQAQPSAHTAYLLPPPYSAQPSTTASAQPSSANTLVPPTPPAMNTSEPGMSTTQRQQHLREQALKSMMGEALSNMLYPIVSQFLSHR